MKPPIDIEGGWEEREAEYRTKTDYVCALRKMGMGWDQIARMADTTKGAARVMWHQRNSFGTNKAHVRRISESLHAAATKRGVTVHRLRYMIMEAIALDPARDTLIDNILDTE